MIENISTRTNASLVPYFVVMHKMFVSNIFGSLMHLTEDSLLIYTFINTCLRPKIALPVQKLYHKELFETLHHQSVKWNKQRPSLKSIDDHVLDSQSNEYMGSTLQVPSKIYALHYLLNNDSKRWSKLLKESSVSEKMATSYIRLICNSSCTLKQRSVGYNWFHGQAWKLLEKTSEPALCNVLVSSGEPLLQWCCTMWQRYPQIYGYFVPLNVQFAFERRPHNQHKMTWLWPSPHTSHEQHYSLISYVPGISISKPRLNQIALWITLMASLHPHPCNELVLTWFPSGCKKEINETANVRQCSGKASACECLNSVSVWNPYQINTGATYRGTCDTVNVWRKEEVCKTLVHEMMHGFEWDFDHPKEQIDQWVHKYFNVDRSTEIRFYEAYVETWATVLNVYMSILYSNNNDTRSEMIFNTLKSERYFAIFQMAKVLTHSGFNAWSDFFCNKACTFDMPPFQQTTAVFSYYIVRAMHLWDIDWFIQTFTSVKFDPHTIRFETWLKHLLDVSNDPQFQNAINTCMQILTKGKAELLSVPTCKGDDAILTKLPPKTSSYWRHTMRAPPKSGDYMTTKEWKTHMSLFSKKVPRKRHHNRLVNTKLNTYIVNTMRMTCTELNPASY